MTVVGFSDLTPSIQLWTPEIPETGHLVIICTWMGAANKHISKYVELHRRLLPAATLLILKCEVTNMILPYSKQQRAIEPAIAPIMKLLEQCEQSDVRPRILLHIFSNGGFSYATQLLIKLQRKRNAALPIIGIICDSSPGGVGYWTTYNTFTKSSSGGFPTSLVASTAAHLLLAVLYVSAAMGRYEIPEALWRRAILDTTLVESKRICYVASKADKIIDWRDVVAHADSARAKGWEVKELIMEDTLHCNHMEKNPQMYHEVVELMWSGEKLDKSKRTSKL